MGELYLTIAFKLLLASTSQEMYLYLRPWTCYTGILWVFIMNYSYTNVIKNLDVDTFSYFV